MKKLLIGLLLLVFMIQLVNAAEVCVVVDYKDGEPDSKCIDIDEGKDGYELLEEIGWSLLWTPDSFYGRMLCKINDVGTDVDAGTGYCEYTGDFWNFVLVDGNEWGHMPVGLTGGDTCWNRDFSWSDWSKVVHYCTKDGDTIGLAFGEAGAEPQMFTANISKIYVDGDKLSDKKVRRGKIEEVFPESTVKFKIELENLYDHSTDIEITDISIEGTIEEIDDGDDIDEELTEFDLAADKKKTKELEFTIPLEVEAKDRLVRIEIKAEDDAGIKYEKEFTYDLEVEKEKHKLKILKAELDKNSYKCGVNALLSFSVINLGGEEEDVELQIVNEELEIDIKESFELSNDAFEASSKYEKRFNIWLPDDVSKGTYALMVTADYSGEKETQNVDLVISECEGAAKVEEDKESEEVTDVQTGDVSDDEDGTEAEVTEEERTTTEKTIAGNLPLVLTGVLGVLIVLIIVLFVVFWVVKR